MTDAKERRWATSYYGDDGEVVNEILTGSEILRDYFPYWSSEMRLVGKESMITEELCIEEWAVVNWARELTDE